MYTAAADPVLVVTSEAALPTAHRVWGVAGWSPPEQREALDWLTLSRFLGWGVQVTRRTPSGFDTDITGGSRYVILACDPDSLGDTWVARLASRLANERLLVVARAGAAGGTWAHLAGAGRQPERIVGASLRWVGPGSEHRWQCRNALEGNALQLLATTVPWAILNGTPCMAARQVGRSVVVTLSFHPSQARDTDGAASALLKHMLIWGAPAPVAWLDFAGSLMLRMDDPGGAQNVHLRSWSYAKLGMMEWRAMIAALQRRNARVSVGYSAGWVDDGDVTRGLLYVDGRVQPRIAGQVYAAPRVQYHDRAGHTPGTWHDYVAEFHGIQAMRAAGVGDVECHGYTHMHPDTGRWAQAPDRYDTATWYREFSNATQATLACRAPQEHPLALSLAALQRYFGVSPTTLICPGDQWTDEVLERALDAGLSLIGNYYTALRDRQRFCWLAHVYAPYLDQVHSAWFDAGLPVAAYFHDRDVALEGVAWLRKWLDGWQTAGARRLMDCRELVAAVGRRVAWQETEALPALVVRSDAAPALVRPLQVFCRFPARSLPARLSVYHDNLSLQLPVRPEGHGVGSVVLPQSTGHASRIPVD